MGNRTRLSRVAARAPAFSRYETYVRIAVERPCGPLAGAEAVLTAAASRRSNGTNRGESRERRGPGVAAHTDFEDSKSSANIGIDSKATGQRLILCNIGDNLALFNNGSNGDSVPATVPGSELSG